MTKVLVFGESNEQKKSLKKIELVYMIDCDADRAIATDKPSDFNYIMLLERGYTEGSSHLNNYDLIMAWDEENDKTLYLGHWNDGVI